MKTRKSRFSVATGMRASRILSRSVGSTLRQRRCAGPRGQLRGWPRLFAAIEHPLSYNETCDTDFTFVHLYPQARHL